MVRGIQSSCGNDVSVYVVVAGPKPSDPILGPGRVA